MNSTAIPSAATEQSDHQQKVKSLAKHASIIDKIDIRLGLAHRTAVFLPRPAGDSNMC